MILMNIRVLSVGENQGYTKRSFCNGNGLSTRSFITAYLECLLRNHWVCRSGPSAAIRSTSSRQSGSKPCEPYSHITNSAEMIKYLLGKL